jgi:hypothetical protein
VKMVEIECLVCAKVVDIPKFVDTDDYNGQLTCRECGSLLRIRLAGSKVKEFAVIEKGFVTPPATREIPVAPVAPPVSRTAARAVVLPEPEPVEEEPGNVNVDEASKYNPLRDYLAGYRASQIQLVFEQLEDILGGKLDKKAQTLKSWWSNDRNKPQSIAWLEAGWQVAEVDLPNQRIVFRREPRPAKPR